MNTGYNVPRLNGRNKPTHCIVGLDGSIMAQVKAFARRDVLPGRPEMAREATLTPKDGASETRVAYADFPLPDEEFRVMDSMKNVSGLRAKVAVFTPRKAFTLVELLVVIAIIAILAAIIFPVFSAVRESTRRGATISQMQKLYSAIKQYELDNRAYPEYLFGPALKADGTPATTAAEVGMTMEEAAATVKKQVPDTDPSAPVVRNAQAAFKNSLYPTYISDLTAFSCPDNPITDTKSKDAAVAARFVQDNDPANPDGVKSLSQAYYKYDAYDISPAIMPDEKLDLNNYQVRYSRVWSDKLLNSTDLGNLSPEIRAMYQNQLLWKSPSADTYLLMTTYHVPSSKIVVMWLNGSAKVLDTGKLVNNAKFAGTGGRDYDAFKLTPTD